MQIRSSTDVSHLAPDGSQRHAALVTAISLLFMAILAPIAHFGVLQAPIAHFGVLQASEI